MDPKYIVYSDGVSSVGLFELDLGNDERQLLKVGVRWLKPEPYTRLDGQLQKTTNCMGGETEWFLLPHSFGCAICKRLIELKVSDLGIAEYFDELSFKRMVSWLEHLEELNGVMEY